MMLQAIYRRTALTALLLGAITSYAQTRPAPPEESCPDGYYAGPRAGRKNYTHEFYTWVVTPDFARRFCMPPEMVDDTLKGAEAIAFRMSTSTGGTDRCVLNDEGKEWCSPPHELRFDVFLRRDLKLPAAHPEIEFFDGSRDHAGWNITAKYRNTSYRRYLAGQHQFPPGEIPHFASWDRGQGYFFVFSGIQRNRMGYVITAFLKEWRYEARWAEDLDLVVLQADMGLNGFDHPQMKKLGVERFALVLTKDQSGKHIHESAIPDDFLHTIVLPEKFMDKVRAAAARPGMSFEERIDVLRQR